MTTERPICEAFVRVAELCEARGEAPITKFPGCWECRVDERWWLAVNGHQEVRKVKCPEGFTTDVEPFHCYVTFNGWPAFIFNPYGGGGAAGEAANEETFIAAVVAATERARRGGGQPDPSDLIAGGRSLSSCVNGLCNKVDACKAAGWCQDRLEP